MVNTVALVGRPNVGKSTLFNRLVETRQAIIDDMPGVTRNCNYGYAEWCGFFFTVIDTGGYVMGSDDKFEVEIRKQVEIAMTNCTTIVFLVDARVGLTGHDKEFANLLRRLKHPVLVLANKSDTPNKAALASEFYALGMGEVYPVSAENGSGTGEFLDALVATFDSTGDKVSDGEIPRIAILGRPNVGKSSLINVLLGEEKSIVTDEAGTTRDAVHSRYNRYGKDFIVIDTAGLRRKSKVVHDIEFYSIMRSIRVLEQSDVCLILIDAEQGLAAQDLNIISLAQKRGKGIILMVNKWDLIEKNTNTARDVAKEMLQKLAPATYIPILFASTRTRQRLFHVIEKVSEVYANKKKKIPTSQLNNTLLPEIVLRPPSLVKGKRVRIKHITQVKANTPSFVFFCNLPQYIQESYKRFLENKLRANFNFEGVPVRLFFRKK